MLRPMKILRRDILKLLQTYINKTENLQYFSQNFLPTLRALKSDFQSNDQNARDPEVLELFATLLSKLGPDLQPFMDQILVHLLSPTLNMIANDFNSFPEFREGFFQLVKSIVMYCADALITMESNSFNTLVQSIIFGCKHEKTEIMDLSL